MKVAIMPRMFVQTNGIEVLSVDIPGDMVKFRVNKALAKFLSSVDARVLDHAKTSMFTDDGITEDTVESNYVSPLTGDEFQAKLSKELVVYDPENSVASPNSLQPGAKVVAIMTPGFVDFTRSKFTCRWSVIAIREKKSSQDVI